MEKNEFLFGEIIKSHSKNGRFLLKNYRKTRKKRLFLMKNCSKFIEKWLKLSKNGLK